MTSAPNTPEVPPEPGPVSWTDLQAHADRQALFLVAEAVSLKEAALAIANDDKVKVSNWVAEAALRRPTPAEDDHWRQHPESGFQAVVVQPFVLAVADEGVPFPEA